MNKSMYVYVFLRTIHKIHSAGSEACKRHSLFDSLFRHPGNWLPMSGPKKTTLNIKEQRKNAKTGSKSKRKKRRKNLIQNSGCRRF